jgi:hypothetical protein
VSLPATAKWVALALLGLVIAIGVAIAAANLTSQQIGISSEAITAGDSLAPKPKAKPQDNRGNDTKGRGGKDDRGGGREEPAEPEPTVPEETAPPETTSAEPPPEGGGAPEDSSGGSDHGGGSDD